MKPKVLVVDDDIDYAQLIAYNLERQGCETVPVHNGVQALRMARAELPDVILLDLMLPDLDGLSVCEILQAQPSTRDIPVLVVSALDESWAETRKTKARAMRYFTKPVDLKMLAESVHAACEKRQVMIRSRLAQKED
jgi:two-component system alkaline phosphatase synthesis response regulator PhoP